MQKTHIGNAGETTYFFLIGQRTHPISSIEGDGAAKRIIFTSLLDFAGPCARHFFFQSQTCVDMFRHADLCVQINVYPMHIPIPRQVPFPS